MSLVLMASATGSPGVTTTALGLTLAWPRHSLLVDADRDPAQAVQAGWLQGQDLGGRGLAHVARAHRERRPVAEEAWLQTVALDDSEAPTRRFLPGFTFPGWQPQFEPVLTELAPALAGLGAADTDVLVDLGRLGHGLSERLVEQADALLVCVRSDLRSLAALRLHLPRVEQQLEGALGSCQLGLVVVGEGRPYGVREIEQQFQPDVWSTIAWEPRQAAVLSDGAPAPRQIGRGALSRSLDRAAHTIDERIRARRDEIGRPAA